VSEVHRGDRPKVTLKAALTLDGRIASASGESRWITGPEARAASHRLRHTHDAVLVGSGTLLADDPALDTRLPGGRNALPVVLDTGLQCPVGARVLSAGRRAVLFCAEDAPARELSADIVRIPRASGGLDLHAALRHLLALGVRSLLVEGGGRVHRGFLDADLADRIELFIAPRVLAGGSGWVGGAPYTLVTAPRFAVVSSAPTGEDLHVVLTRRPSS